jgi:hypothetical protein
MFGRGDVSAEKILRIKLLTSVTPANSSSFRQVYKGSCAAALKEE